MKIKPETKLVVLIGRFEDEHPYYNFFEELNYDFDHRINLDNFTPKETMQIIKTIVKTLRSKDKKIFVQVLSNSYVEYISSFIRLSQLTSVKRTELGFSKNDYILPSEIEIYSYSKFYNNYINIKLDKEFEFATDYFLEPFEKIYEKSIKTRKALEKEREVNEDE